MSKLNKNLDGKAHKISNNEKVNIRNKEIVDEICRNSEISIGKEAMYIIILIWTGGIFLNKNNNIGYFETLMIIFTVCIAIYISEITFNKRNTD